MPDSVSFLLNGAPVCATAGASVAAALIDHGCFQFRRSVRGEWRGPICGMGICFECRVTIDGVPHRRSCQVICRDGMRVETK